MNKFITFLGGGVISYFMRMSLTFILTESFKLYYLYSYIIILSFIFGFNYFFSLKVTFDSEGTTMVLLRYILFYFIFYLLDILSVYLITELSSAYYLVSITITAFIVSIVKFFAYQNVVFIK